MNDDAIAKLLRDAVDDEALEDDTELAVLLVPPSAARKDAMARAVLAATDVRPRRATPLRLVARAAAVVGPLAAVGAFALLVASRVAAPPARPPRLPAYTLGIASDAQTARAPAASMGPVAHLHRAAAFEMIARPDTRAEVPVAVKALLVQGGRIGRWSPPIEIDEGGSVRVAGALPALFPAARGTYDVVLVIGPVGALPEGDALADLARVHDASGQSALRILRGRVVIDD